MKLKKIYIEITNRCNLNCSFCIHNKRKVFDMDRDKYTYIIDKIKGYTKEIYLHVLGEPLIHKDINYLIDYASNNNLLVNITTNGYLIDKIKNNYNIHRLNISIHSYNPKYNIALVDYLNNTFTVIDNLRDKTYVTIRLWVKSNYNDKVLDYINKRYNVSINNINDNQKIKITSNLLIDTFHEFIWPDLNNNYYSEIGSCYGLKNHIGILNDGTIIPCCLDTSGVIRLGNIYTDTIDDIYSKKIVKDMIKGFNTNKKICELCKHCNFLQGGSYENNKLE